MCVCVCVCAYGGGRGCPEGTGRRFWGNFSRYLAASPSGASKLSCPGGGDGFTIIIFFLIYTGIKLDFPLPLSFVIKADFFFLFF